MPNNFGLNPVVNAAGISLISLPASAGGSPPEAASGEFLCLLCSSSGGFMIPPHDFFGWFLSPPNASDGGILPPLYRLLIFSCLPHQCYRIPTLPICLLIYPSHCLRRPV